MSAFQKFGISAEFEQSPSLAAMTFTFQERLAKSHGPVVVCVSHALEDFGGGEDAVQMWWEGLQRASGGRRLVVLVLERNSCERFKPTSLLGGGHAFVPKEKFPAGTDNSSYGMAIILPEGAVRKRPPTDITGSSGCRTTAAATYQGPPLCPECRDPMMLRTNKTGYNPGSQFWGCANFPRCKGKRHR